MNTKNFFKRIVNAPFVKDESGAAMIEYALLAALIALAAIAVLTALGGGVTATFQRVVDGLAGVGIG